MNPWKRVKSGIYRHLPTGTLYERGKIDGKRTFRVLPSQTITEAVSDREELRTKRRRIDLGLESPHDEKLKWTVAKVLEVYRDADCPDRRMAKRPSRSEAEEKRRVETLLRFFTHQLVRDLNRSVCADYGAWRMKRVREGFDGRRSVEAELVTLSNALDFSHISTEPVRNRKRFYQPSKARHARDCAPASGDELHEICILMFAGNFRTQVLAWQALFEAFTGIRTNEALLLKVSAKRREQAGFVERGKWLWLHRSKSGVNPWVVLDVRPELRKLIAAHREWLKKYYPDSPWYFPSAEDPNKPVTISALNRYLSRLHKSGDLPRKITSHGLRAFYVLVRRSQGIADGQIAAEIGDKTTTLIASTYGGIPPKWKGGPEISFMPTKGKPAWAFAKEPTKMLKHLRKC